MIAVLGSTLGISVSGCLGTSFGEADRSDLSEYDEQGLQSYEEGYELSQDALELFETSVWDYFDRDTEPDLPESEWLELQDTIQDRTKDFSESVNRFTEARQLSESAAFNEPALNAEEWTENYSNACRELSDAALFYGREMVAEWGELYEHQQAEEHLLNAEEVGKPLNPEELLNRILDDY